MVFLQPLGATGVYFPMDWLPGVKTFNAIDVTDQYMNNIQTDSDLVAVSIRALNKKANGVSISNHNRRR